MPPTLQTIFCENFETFAQSRSLPPPIHKAARALMQCRTAELGGHVQKCPDGHVERIWYNSCKHRCGPQCAEIHRERGLQSTKERLLACEHYQVIFTIPHELHEVWLLNPAVMPSLLFRSVRDTLIELLADPRYLGALPGLLSSLHTWGQTLILHPHLHCLVTAGGWTEEGVWRPVSKGYLLPVKMVKVVYRGKLLDAIGTALDRGELQLPAQQSVSQLRSLLNKLGRKK